MEKKSIYICPEDCQDFRGEDGCGSGHIDTSFIYEKEGDYPICPFYSKPLMGDMTSVEAIKILTLDKTCDFEGDANDLEKAVQLGIEALRRHMAQECCRVNVIVGPLPGEARE